MNPPATQALPRARRVVFVCTANTARSHLAAALWRQASPVDATSGGTHPGDRIHPGARAVAGRHHLELPDVPPRLLAGNRSQPAHGSMTPLVSGSRSLLSGAMSCGSGKPAVVRTEPACLAHRHSGQGVVAADSSCLISAGLGTRPETSTLSSTTSPGVDMIP